MAKGGGGNEDGNLEIYVLAFFALVGIIFAIYHFYYQEILLVWKYVRIGESYLFIWLSYLIPGQWKPQFPGIIDFLSSTSHQELTSKSVNMVDSHVRPYLGPIFGLIIFYMGHKMSGKSMKISRKMDINSLLRDRANVFEHLRDYENYDPNEELVEYERDNEHAMIHAAPLKPDEFCLMNPPIGLEEKAKKRKDYRKTIWNKKDRFDIDMVRESLESQLGPLYEGISSLKDEYALAFDYLNGKVKISRDEIYTMTMHIIQKHVNGKHDEMGHVEGQIYNHLTTSKKKTKKKIPFNFTLDQASVRKIYGIQKKDPALHALFIKLKSENIMNNHGYCSTGLVALMKEASSRNNFSLNVIRNKLKSKNRPLYYALNCVGRAGSFIESTGINTHYTFELDTSAPSASPQVELAIIGIQEELNLTKEE